MNSSIVITGASGFIGKHLISAFLSKGYSLCAVIRSEGKKTELVDFFEKNGTEISNLSFVISDLKDVSADKFEKPVYDAWFHLAWGGVNRDGINDCDIQEENVVFSKQCLKCASELNCSFFADLGSRAEYPGDAGIIEETMPESSLSVYGAKKKEFYEYAKMYCKENGMRYVHFRVFSAMGPGDHPWSLVMTACKKFLNNEPMQFGACTQMWNYLDVRDIAELVILVYKRIREGINPEGSGEIINIANSISRPLKEYVMDMYDVCSSTSQLSFGDNEGFSSVPSLNGIGKYGIEYREIPFKDSIRDIIESISFD